MSDVKPNMHRQFAQEDFEASLDALQQLSESSDDDPDSDLFPDDLISWDDVADDLENFFGDRLDPDPDEKPTDPD